MSFLVSWVLQLRLEPKGFINAKSLKFNWTVSNFAWHWSTWYQRIEEHTISDSVLNGKQKRGDGKEWCCKLTQWDTTMERGSELKCGPQQRDVLSQQRHHVQWTTLRSTCSESSYIKLRHFTYKEKVYVCVFCWHEGQPCLPQKWDFDENCLFTDNADQ